jgi:hypothetical protein
MPPNQKSVDRQLRFDLRTTRPAPGPLEGTDGINDSAGERMFRVDRSFEYAIAPLNQTADRQPSRDDDSPQLSTIRELPSRQRLGRQRPRCGEATVSPQQRPKPSVELSELHGGRPVSHRRRSTDPIDLALYATRGSILRFGKRRTGSREPSTRGAGRCARASDPHPLYTSCSSARIVNRQIAAAFVNAPRASRHHMWPLMIARWDAAESPERLAKASRKYFEPICTLLLERRPLYR